MEGVLICGVCADQHIGVARSSNDVTYFGVVLLCEAERLMDAKLH
jgi:hypothetical protein